MTQHKWLVVVLGAIALSGLASCTSSNSSTSQVVARGQEEVKITGSGTAYAPLKVIANAYASQASNVKVTFLPHSQSSSGVVGAKEGLVNIGSVTRKPKPEEDDGSLGYQLLAVDALLVATHPSVGKISNLSTEELKAIYSGSVTNWQQLGGVDAEIIVLDRPEDESAKRLLRQYYLGDELKMSPNAVVLRHESDLIAAVQNTPHSIGAFSLAQAITNQLPVNHLSLNGVAATPENVKTGKYTMVRKLGIVFQNNASAVTQDLINFAVSETGKGALVESGFVPTSQVVE